MNPAPIVLFDGICGFCVSSVVFIIRHDKSAIFRFVSNQSATGRQLLLDADLNPESLPSLVVISSGQVSMRSDAVLEIARQLNFPWNLLSALKIVPQKFRDWLYDLIAKHRYRLMGKRDICLILSDDMHARFLP